MSIMGLLCKTNRAINRNLDKLHSLGILIVRLYIAEVFLRAGWTKIQSWDSTLFLFKHEYNVPFLSPETAAYLGTGAEIVAPILLAIGLLDRLPAIALFLFNIVAVVSYAYLHTANGSAALQHHIYWGLLLMMLMLHGPGKWTLDTLLWRKHCQAHY